LGDGVEIETVTAGGLWNCLADPTQVENAVLNLAINARDAMDGHGKLTIEVGNASLDDAYVAQHVDVTAGQYVMIAVTDTGGGIAPDKLEHVFEPFFTTKPEGQGTGLGLSMVYGFVKQSGGHVKIYSEVNQGTTVRLYLPRTRQDETIAAPSVVEAISGSETILLVEDDLGVRETAAEMLSDLGYRVLKSKNADSALAIVESGAEIDLLFTDVVMPGVLRSTELADLFMQRFPNAAVLYTSGYTQNAIVHAGRLDPGVELLSKPYSRDDLSRKIRQVLDRRKSQTTSKAAGKALVRRRTVLLLEDEPLIRMSTADMLTELELTVIEAGTTREALKLLQDNEVDVLVADLTLPDGSGFDVARAAKQANADVLVIFATGKSIDTPSDLAGAKWLSKPYDFSTLAKILSGAIRD
jgi:CheY-like chemotaxis protein